MSEPAVSIHPYFKIHPGKLDAVKALLTRFVEKTSSETTCIAYEFTINGDLVFCREAYTDAEGALAHLTNVGAELTEMLTPLRPRAPRNPRPRGRTRKTQRPAG